MRNRQSTAGLVIRAAAAALALGGGAAGAAEPDEARYENPILFADYSDPDVIRVGEDYYLVASSFHFSPGIPVLHSRDLVHWTIIGHVLPRLPFGPLYDMPGPHSLDDTRSKPIGRTKYASGVWAPSIRYHDGRFHVTFATPDEGVFMASADDPAGPWDAPVQLLAGAGYEDPCPFWDEEGSAWLIHGRVGAGPLILHRMSADGSGVLDEGVVVAQDKEKLPVLEGPKLIKRDGWYYIFAPIGGVGTGPQAVGRSRRITGPYEWREVLKPGNGLAGPHQGGYVETPSGEGWFIHFQSTGALGRIVYLQPVRWEDGWPVMGEDSVPVSSWRMPDTGSAPTQDRLQDSDEFAAPMLGLQWSWNHNPDNEAWSFSERPGWLRLHALPADHLVTARNTLTQILQGPRSTIETQLDVSGMREGQRAGLALFGVRPAWIGAVRESGVTRVVLSNAGVETAGPPIAGKTIELRAQISPDQNGHYAWRAGPDDDWHAMGGAIPLAQFSWWKGSRPALFSYATGDPGGVADFDWMHVRGGGDAN